MKLILTKSFNDQVIEGDRVSSILWTPDQKYRHGIYGLENGNGNWLMLKGNDWLIVEADDQIINGDDFVKFNTGKIIFRGTSEELANTDYCQNMATEDEHSAYHWALLIGNNDVMINRINHSKYAYFWAMNIGNNDVMLPKVTEPEYAYYWAANIGDVDIMMPFFENDEIFMECWKEL